MNYNRIILVGRLTKDPDVRTTASGVPVTTFRIAVDRPQSSEARQQGTPKETDFIDIVTWRNQAEYAANYLTKGKLILVEGRLQLREYVNEQDGQRRRVAEVVADNTRIMEKRQDSEGGDGFEEGGGYNSGQGQGGNRGGYDRGNSGGGGGGYERAPAQAPARGQSGGGQGGGGGYDRAPSRGSGGGARNAPQQNSYDDDDMGDPFAE
jgi:single-strand DNA-binding protein